MKSIYISTIPGASLKTCYFICNRESFRVTSVTSIGTRPTNNPWENFIRMTRVGWLYVKPAPFKQTNKLMDIVASQCELMLMVWS